MIAAIVQARMGSSRLPGKVLMDICGKTMIHRILDAASRAKNVNALIAAIPDGPDDNELFEHIRLLGFEVYRGSTDDVLARFHGAATKLGLKSGDGVVRLTADCPLMLPEMIEQVVDAFVKNSVTYASNVRPPTYPDGLDVEVFSFDDLESAHRNARKTSEREHVTPYVYETASASINLRNRTDLSDIRLTVDHIDDLEFVREYVQRFTCVDLKVIRDQVSLISDARSHMRNEGYQKSLKEEST